MSDPSTSSAEAFPAKTYPSLALELASKVLGAVSGSSTSDSFASFDPATWSLRTSQHFGPEGSTSSSVVLPKAGMTRFGSLFALPTLERLTDGNGSSSSRGDPAWATPTARDWRSGKASEATHAKNARPLSEQVGKLWPTATATDAKGSRRNRLDGTRYGVRSNPGETLLDRALAMSGLPAPETQKRGRPTSSDIPAELPLWAESSTRDS